MSENDSLPESLTELNDYCPKEYRDEFGYLRDKNGKLVAPGPYGHIETHHPYWMPDKETCEERLREIFGDDPKKKKK